MFLRHGFIFYNNKYKIIKAALNDLAWSHNFNTRKINIYCLPYALVSVLREVQSFLLLLLIGMGCLSRLRSVVAFILLRKNLKNILIHY